MGRTKKYATEEEAREAKKAQMKAAYERRKQARSSSSPPKTSTETPSTIQETVIQFVEDTPPKARKLKISEKAQLWDELEKMITSATR